MEIDRLVREATLLQNLSGSLGTSPQAIFATNGQLSGLDVPRGRSWDITAVDVTLALSLFAGAVQVAPGAVDVFVYAASIPIGEVQLSAFGFASGATNEYIFRGILSLPSPVSIVSQDRPFHIDVSATAVAGAVPDGTSLRLTNFGDNTLLRFYGGLSK